MPTQANRWINRMDWSLILMYIVLVCFGWINIYSTTSENDTFSNIFDFSKNYGMQLIWVATAFILAFFVLIINSRFYSVFSYYIYLAVIVLLILVLFIGIEVNNSRSWFSIGRIRIQPAELAKLATSLALAKIMSLYGFKLKTFNGWAKVLGLILLPVALILLQKDWGSASVFFIFILMFYREGMPGWIVAAAFFTIALFIMSLLIEPISVLAFLLALTLILFALINRRYLHAFLAGVIVLFTFFILYYGQKLTNIIIFDKFTLLLIATIILTLTAVIYASRTKIRSVFFILLFLIGSLGMSLSVDYIYDKILKSHHRDRIDDMLGIRVDNRGVGYHVNQSKIAIGSGGFTGKGFLQGTQTRLNFVPEQSTDFIFCTIGEEWGFVGSFLIIALYITFLTRVVMVAERQKHIFARIYGYCVASIIFFHFFVNISMTIGLAPVIGIPLPYISYGGSSLWSFTILLFILIKLDAVRLGER